MVDADSHLKLLLMSILEIYAVFEHIDMMFMIEAFISRLAQVNPHYSLLCSDFGVLGHMWSQNDVITSYIIVDVNSHRKLLSISIIDIFKVFEHIDMLSIGKQPYTVIPTLLGSDHFGVLGYLWSQHVVIISL